MLITILVYPSYHRHFIRLLTSRTQIWSEMVVDKVLTHNPDNKQVLGDHLGFTAFEEPMVLQLGGSDPETLARATKIVHEYGYTEVNLNAGCPSCRVAGLGEFGAAMMHKPDLVKQCLEAMSHAAPISVSLKTRLGVDDLDTTEYFNSFVDTILSSQLAPTANFSLVIHARKAWLNGLSPAQNRTIPPLNYDRAFQVCGAKTGLKWYLNGGIHSLEEAVDIFNKAPSNMEGVMMGRAAMNTPCLFANADMLLYGEPSNPVTAASRRNLLEAYCEYLGDKYPVEFEGPGISVGKAFNAIKPIIGVFHGMKNNKQRWRANLDHMVRNPENRRELGIAGIVQEACKDVDQDFLDLKLA